MLRERQPNSIRNSVKFLRDIIGSVRLEEMDDRPKISRTLSYDRPESSVIFRLAWYTVAGKPGVILNEHSEAESQIFKGKAIFSVKSDDGDVTIRIWVEEAQRSVEFTAWGEDESALKMMVDGIAEHFEDAVEKYNELPDDEQSRLKRALTAKTCWDRLVFEILNKAPLSSIYIQVAHGREMLIKATEGEEVQPTSLTTSAWLSKMEEYSKDESLPGDIAMELAKKSVEWKKATHGVIEEYLK